MAQATKLIVTDRTLMRAKYGQPGWAKVRAAVRGLITADRGRGITTKLVLIDGANAAAAKQQIDAAFAASAPDYLMLLGAPDVVAQARLNNPLWTGNPDDDPDQFVDTDLPYACDAPLGTSIAAYRGPTRVVGRLPDLVGAKDPGYLLKLLARATTWKSFDAPRPLEVLAISTHTWRRSTQTSIAAISGAAGPVLTTPPGGPSWPSGTWNHPLVFVNGHGAQLDPTWYGEQSRGQVNLPHAVDAARLRGVVRPGTVVAAECCYGSMHWNPAQAGGQAGVAATLLAEGAHGVWASSTTSYGPAVGNSGADITTRMFLETVVAGGSLGRAGLEARQRFVAHAVSLDPVDLKTLAQFDLLGDPSVHPIAAVHTDPDTPVAAATEPPAGVGRRRATLRSTGAGLAATVGAVHDEALPRPGITRTRFGAAAGLTPDEIAALQIRTFDVDQPPMAIASPDAGPAVAPERYHVAFTGANRRRAVVVVRTGAGATPTARRLYRKDGAT